MDDAVNTPRFQIKSESVSGSGGLGGPATAATTTGSASGGTMGVVNVGVVNGVAEGSAKDKGHGERKRQVRFSVYNEIGLFLITWFAEGWRRRAGLLGLQGYVYTGVEEGTYGCVMLSLFRKTWSFLNSCFRRC